MASRLILLLTLGTRSTADPGQVPYSTTTPMRPRSVKCDVVRDRAGTATLLSLKRTWVYLMQR
ncbi:hypothetical protein AF72_07030 [Xylella taiwanensis]|uniref:Uncharacterized protein n=1 Tax=Xylella taiwanensis TaxID=1444770 RepID=Z9JK88_9GAMM|nr:hypothetical protein AB672_07170 [Xylella taiwanensis]EWS78251.1 hypothetical protein AF72_07030 [Xylella taiwanensis]